MGDRLSFRTWGRQVMASGYEPGYLPESEVGVLPTWAVVTAPFPQSSTYSDKVWSADAGRLGRLEVGLWTHRPESRVPRGTAARWALLLLCRGVDPSRGLDMDETVDELMQLTGRSSSGGARSGRRGLRRAVRDVLDCGIVQTVGLESRNVSPVLGLRKLEIVRDPLKLKITRLNGLFVRSVEKGVPVDMRALRLVGRDALAWDLLVFVAWRVRPLDRPTVIRWDWLRAQLGSRMQCPRSFRSRVKKAMRKVETLYPNLVAESAEDGLVLSPSPPMFEILRSGRTS